MEMLKLRSLKILNEIEYVKKALKSHEKGIKKACKD